MCYTYSNIYYKTDNADNELKYLEQALNDRTPEYSVKQMQEISIRMRWNQDLTLRQ